MSNKIDKPKQAAPQLIEKMKSKGVTFKYSTEEKAAEYLTDKNNYLRTAAYRKNYQKYNNGSNIGKYIDLDFSYLQELSTIDMHFRFLVSKMCLDIEHDLKVRMLKDIETAPTTDGYDIVNVFLSHNNYIIGKLEATSASPFTSDLIHKYFTVQRVPGTWDFSSTRRNQPDYCKNNFHQSLSTEKETLLSSNAWIRSSALYL